MEDDKRLAEIEEVCFGAWIPGLYRYSTKEDDQLIFHNHKLALISVW
jgi:hypothetical protein